MIDSKIIKKQINFQNIRDHNEIVELFELILGNSNSIATHAVTICNLLAHTFVLKISELVQLSIEKQVMGWDTYNPSPTYAEKTTFSYQNN